LKCLPTALFSMCFPRSLTYSRPAA
jgi:hypothetical protein